jgi:hypothetical protein
MRCCFIICLAGALWVGGCRSAKNPEPAEGSSRRVIRSEAIQPKTSVRPVNVARGRVVSVREDLRFLIADFAGSKLPQLDQELAVYRFDQKVAEIKVSGPFRGTTVAADITAGDPKPGDLVRER